MAEKDFVLTGGIDDRDIIETLKRVVAQAGKAGADAGKALDKGLGDAAKRSAVGENLLKDIETNANRFPAVIRSSLSRSVQAATSPTNQLGSQVAKGLQGGADKIPSILNKAFASASGIGAAAGQKIGAGLQKALSGIGAKSISGITTELSKLQSQQVKLRVDSSEFAAIGGKIRELESQLQQVNRRQLAVNTDPRSLVVMRQKVSDLTSELEKVAVGSPAFRALKRDIAATTGDLEKAERAANGARQTFGGLAQTLAGIGAGAAIGGFLRSSIQEAAELETITRKLTNTLGQQGAAGAIAFTRKLSADLGLSFKTLAGTFAGFTAAASAANVPMEVQKGLFAAVARAGQSLGLSNDELSGSLLALQQVASKGTVQMEELRGQLGERLPIAFAATARGLGITDKALIKLVESGKLTAAEFFPALTKGLNELTAGSTGPATAAQNFEKLATAWTDLQASFGTSLLPEVTKQVTTLTQALEGLGVELKAKDLRQMFGVTVGEAEQLVGFLKSIQERYNLTWQEATKLLGVAIKNTGASRDWFGELNLGGQQFSQVQTGLIDLAIEWRSKHRDVKQEMLQQAAAAAAVAAAAEAQRKAQVESLALATAQAQAYQAISEAQGRSQLQSLDNQLQAGNALLNLSRAISELESSRFSLASSVLSAQLEEANARGATEGTINRIKAQAAQVEAQAAAARLQGLQRAQALEAQILNITQRRQVLEANLGINQARAELLDKQNELSKAMLGNDQKAQEIASANVQVASQRLGIAQQNLGLIQQLQPLERQIAEAGREKALNEAQAAAYTATFKANLADAVKPGGELASSAGRTAVKFSELGVGTQELVKGLSSSNGILGELSRRMLTVSQGSSIAAASARQIGLYGRGSVNSYAGIGTSLDQAGTSAEAFAGSGIDDATNAAASGAAVLNRNMNQAVSGARAFYDALAAASGLPGARWAGGGVEAGGKYRINDGPGLRSLGTESFLSRSGRLSLINRPANSLWTAPSDGVVIPAATTAKLQAQGILPGGGGGRRAARAVAPGGRADASHSRLEAAITTLTAAVTYLAGKDWSVRVPDTSGGRRRQLLHMISALG